MAFKMDFMKEALDTVCSKSEGENVLKIQTKHEDCPLCGGKIRLQERSLEKGHLICYSEKGIKRLIHLEYRCEEEHCRTGLFYGYCVKKGGKKIFDKDCLENEYLVVSRKTAFGISWLYGATLKIYHFNGTFDRLAAEFNDFHNFGNILFYI